jgi:hypothetical protein
MARATEVQLTVRFMESLRRKLELAARRNHRSMNTEIVHRLETSLSRDAGRAAGERAAAQLEKEIQKEMGVTLTAADKVRYALEVLNAYFEKSGESNEGTS